MKKFTLKIFLLKVKARCNINCSYCYEFNSADQSWRNKPGSMDMKIVQKTAIRIREHILKHELDNISIVFHGGEPLLASPEWYKETFGVFARHLPGNIKVTYGLQTNGILLNESYLDLFKNHHVHIGISLDGTKASNDKFRVDHKGRSTFEKVLNGIRLLNQPQYKFIQSGILSVINPANDPIETFRFLSSLDMKAVDFLYPHYNYSSPPPFPSGAISQWLISVFDEWWDTDSEIRIRIFEDIMNLMLGGRYSTENLGLAPVELLVIQTDGGYEAVDSLKSTFSGAAFTGKNVCTDDFDEVLSHPLIKSRFERLENLCSTCRKCVFKNVCGGGYIPHRYSEVSGFDNPSIYCEDLKILFNHVRAKLSDEVPELKNQMTL